MKLEHDAAYYRRREMKARDLAGKSQEVSIQRIHLEMAEKYRTLAQEAEAPQNTNRGRSS